MKDSKIAYNEGLGLLEEAVSKLSHAKSCFLSSSNATDDFPTARHEIADVAKKVEAIQKELNKLWNSAYDNRIQ